MRRLWLLGWLALAVPLRAQDGGGDVPLPTDEITEADRAAIRAELAANRAAHGIPEPRAQAGKTQAVAFAWPLMLPPSIPDLGLATVSAHYDHDRTTGITQDFACGTRTYDQHEGTDFAPWPFPVLRMQQNETQIVAAVAGTIVGKRDGNFDLHCSAVTGAQWNAVYVQHDDGSVAWYGHMKNGSLTPKAVGERVATGELLGIVGSSGRSTGPHLHLEVYDPNGNLIDPYAGSCNRLNGQTSWWAAQEPYSNPRLHAVRTGSAAPVVRTCPNPEQPNEKRSFAPNEAIVFSAYFRDQAAGDEIRWRVIGPDGQPATVRHSDGTPMSEWTHAPSSGGRSTHWYYTRYLPADAPTGQWRVETTYKDQFLTRTFAVGEPLASDDDRRLDEAMGTLYPNPFAETATLRATLAPGLRVRVEAFDLIGRRAALLFNGRAGGEGTLTLDTRSLAPGAYVLHIATDRATTTRLGVRR
ncbi:MAG: peptidoglycan DD-metalloendopeptidase family protein [Bacteroidetes bacterium]|nr:peptidoglycan DD-metalloendopeptidase family protein [Bacteroidota bacterium]